jgi:hypothetical protein
MFDHSDDPPAVGDASAVPVAPEGGVARSPAAERFNTCRWRAQEQGHHCTHRDVLPLAGREGFNPEAWCPDCNFFKVRRTPKKRERNEFGIGY